MARVLSYARWRGLNRGIRYVVLMLAAAVQIHTAQTRVNSSIDLDRTLSPEHACRSFERPIQFLSETALLVLSGPEGYCYLSVNQLALKLISTDGKVLATKPWHSTDPGLVFAPGRLLLATPEGLEVDDETLTPIQSLTLPEHRAAPIMVVRQQGTVSVLLYDQSPYGSHEFLYGGEPLRLLKASEPRQNETAPRVFEFSDGLTIVRKGESLICSNDRHSGAVIMNLKWVIPPCERYVNCQAYGAGSGVRVSTGKFERVLVFSNGSKFPVTDAAGLFPYFRVQVFDIETGQSIYKEENVIRTAERYAAISPDGDRLATTDGRKITIRALP